MTPLPRVLTRWSVVFGSTLAACAMAACMDGSAAVGPPRPDDERPLEDDTDVDQDDTGDAGECDALEVLDRNGCTGCHTSGTSTAGGLDLASDGVGERIVGQNSIHLACGDRIADPKAPEASLLLRAVAPDRYAGHGSDDCDPAAMPPSPMSAMPPEDVDCLEAWIAGLEPVEQVDHGELAEALSVLQRVKMLMHGGAVTPDELAAATGPEDRIDPGALRSLVEAWLRTPEFHSKRRQFLRLTLQQTPSDINYFYQFRNTVPSGLIGGVRSNLQDSMILTAERIIDHGEDFRTIVTTNEWELTSALVLALRMVDNEPAYNRRGNFVKNHPNNDITYPFRTETWDRRADTEDWRTITLHHDPASTAYLDADVFMEQTFIDEMRALPDGGSITLRTPRIGYFTTPAFFQTWGTNVDNDYRVTLNQALIIGTGRTFTAGDATPHNTDLSAVDPELFPTDSECYGCHKNMEPMVGVFQQEFDSIHSRWIGPEGREVGPTDFVFQSATEPVEDLHEWADALAHHPEFGRAWVLKLCEWASSTPCDPNSQAVLDLTDAFEASGYDLEQLFIELFSSPIVTHTSYVEDTALPGAQVSLTRQGHFCQAMRVRLEGAMDAQGRSGGGVVDVCRSTDTAELMASSIPASEYVRGQVGFQQPSDLNALTALSFKGVCVGSAPRIVNPNQRGVFRGGRDAQVAESLDLMTSQVLGLPEGTDAYIERRELLQRLFDVQTASPACADAEALDRAFDTDGDPECGLGADTMQALQGVWIAACQSPSLTGVGL